MSNHCFCCVCGQNISRFLPYRGGSENRPFLMKMLDVVGSDVDHFLCPNCGAHDRERHLILYLTELGLLNIFSRSRVLHFAPEQWLSKLIEIQIPDEYIKADLYPQFPDIKKIDLLKIPYPDNYFDVVIANHVLEHVGDAGKALEELHRVLKQGGKAILQTPYSNKLHNTLVDEGIDDANTRLQLYGQEDHVRLFGKDIFKRIEQAGFCSLVVNHNEVLSQYSSEVYGINAAEPFFLFQVSENKPLSSVGALVSVCVITYQHARYIEQCLESIVNQQTDFQFEIIIGDDGSTDGTSEICREYQRKYPDLIKLTIHDRTQNRAAYSGGPGRYNLVKTLGQAKGSYIALCEGDDYWLDKNKLQQQIDFLENNLHFSICFHSVLIDDGKGLNKSSLNRHTKEESSLIDLASHNYIHTPSVVYRNVFPGVFPDFFYTSPVADYLLHIFAAEKGKIQFLDKEMAVYRVHEESYWSSQSHEHRLHKWMKVVFPLIGYFEDKKDISEIFIDQYFRTSIGLLGTSDDRVNVYSDVVDDLIGFIIKESIKAHALIGGSLIRILTAALENKYSGLNGNLQDNLFCKASNLIFDELSLLSGQDKEIKLISKYGKVEEVIALLRDRLKKNSNNKDIRNILNKFSEHEEAYQYRQWIAGHDLLEIDGQLFAERMMLQWLSRPVFHLVLFLFPGEDELLADTIDSLAAQMYSQWRFSVIAGEPCPDPIFDQFEALQWVQVKQNQNPYDVLNAVIGAVEADWVAFIEPGATFQPHSLIRLGDYINLNKHWHLIYVDEDEKGPDGLRRNPKFKPDFNLDLLRSDFYIGGFCAIKREKLLEIGGIQATPDFENYDLAFKVFEKYGAEVFCHIADVLCHAPESSRRTRDTKIKRIVVENHLIRSGVAADVDVGYLAGTHRIVYHNTDTPKVSVIIPTRDKLEFFQPCLESLMEKTDYPDFEVLVVNNQSQDPDILQYFEELPGFYSGRVRVLEYDEEFNFSAISNLAARHANGQYLLFLNNDTEIIQSQWLSRMMAHAQRPEVGIVGARLVLPESGLVQHVGVVLGLDLIANHPYIGLMDIQSPGYMGRALSDQNYSAVTGACLLVRSEVYRDVEGMDEENFPISYNDIDLCLKVRQAGFLVVYTPYATLIHHSSVSQKSERNPEEVARRNAVFCNSRDKMFDKWRDIIANDPSYNRNLSLTSREFKVDSSLPCNWDVNFHDRQRVLGLPLSGGAGDYRIILPFEALSRSGLMQCEYIRLLRNQSRRLNAAEIERLAPDTLVVHSALNDLELTYLEELKRLNKNLFIVFALDDLVTQIPKKSSVYANFMRNYRDAKPRLRKALSLCDRLVVSTEPLADLCADMIEDIHVVPNRLNKDVWCYLTSLRQQGTKPRVGWAGAQQHQGDLEIIFEVVKETAREIDWIFMGMCPDEIVPYVKENHGFVPFDQYPAKLASLNLDLAIAPLEDCQFNDAKSNLRLLEYGILGWPVVCSDVFPYRSHDAPVTRVKNDKQEWLSAIRDCLSDLDSNYSAGDKLRQWVLERFILEDHLDEWQRALMR